jgi:hypothetical protein
LRRIDRAEFQKKDEFRKNVTLRAFITPDKHIDINIEKLKDFYRRADAFVRFINNWIHPVTE